MEAVTLTNSGDSTARRELDFYPTPPNVTHALLRFLELQPCMIWEPACGDGSMSRVLEQYGHAVVSTDLRDTGFGSGGVDFLKSDIPCDAIITNPPFDESHQFIEHAVGQGAKVVAMLLKSQYWHAAKRKALFDKYPPAYVLPLTWRPDFLFDQRKPGERANPTMEVGWTVWIAGDSNTKYRPLTRVNT